MALGLKDWILLKRHPGFLPFLLPQTVLNGFMKEKVTILLLGVNRG
jgi:hypothetical protein